jgi:hypothetical protein
MAVQMTRPCAKPWQQSPAWLFLTCMALFSGCATLGDKQPNPPITASEVITMTKEGVPANIIVDKMRNSGTAYRLTAEQIAKLHDQGVADKVINYMQQTYLYAVRQDQSLAGGDYWSLGADGFWYGGPYYGWPPEWWIVTQRGGHRDRGRSDGDGWHDGGEWHDGGAAGMGGHGGKR